MRNLHRVKFTGKVFIQYFYRKSQQRNELEREEVCQTRRFDSQRHFTTLKISKKGFLVIFVGTHVRIWSHV